MPGPEFTSTLVVVDKSSAALSNIAGAAENASKKVDSLVSSLDQISNVNKLSTSEFDNFCFDSCLPGLSSIADAAEDASKKVGSLVSSFDQMSNMNKIPEIDFGKFNFDSVTSAIDKAISSGFVKLSSKPMMEKLRSSIEGIADVASDAIEDALSYDELTKEFKPMIEKLKTSIQNRAKSAFGAMKKVFGVISKPFSALSKLGSKSFGFLYSVQSLVSGIASSMAMVDTATNQRARFAKLAGIEGLKGQDRFNRSEEMRLYASSLASNLGVNTESFNEQLMGFANNRAFKSFEEAADFASLLNKSFVANGVDAREAESAVTQLLQGLSKGRLQGEDLMSILSAAPNIGGLLEKSYAQLNGKSEKDVAGKVRDLASAGELTGVVIKNALFGARAEIEKDFNEMPQTFDAAMTRLKNSAFEAFQPVVTMLSNFANSDEFKRLISVISSAVSLTASLVESIGEIVSPVANGVLTGISSMAEGIGTFFDSFGARGGKYKNRELKELKNETVKHLTLTERYILKVANEVGYVGDMIDSERQSMDAIIDQNKRALPQKTFAEYRAERIDEALENSRIRRAEELARYANGYGDDSENSKWDRMNQLEQLDAISDYYDSLSDTGIYSSSQLEDLRRSLREDEIALTAARSQLEDLKRGAFGDVNQKSVMSQIDKLQTRQQSLDEAIIDKEVAIASALELVARFGEETAKNTKKVTIDRDSILFMKSMTTAEIINRYNTTSSSIVQNNTFNNNQNPLRARNTLQSDLRRVQNASNGG